jgi:hypothetical protein
VCRVQSAPTEAGNVGEDLERLGFVRSGGRQADVVDDHELRSHDPLHDLARRGVDPGASDYRRQRLQGEPIDPEIAVDRGMVDRLGEVRFAGS